MIGSMVDGWQGGGIDRRSVQKHLFAASCFDRLAARIWDGRKLGKHFATVYPSSIPVETAPSSFPTKISERDG